MSNPGSVKTAIHKFIYATREFLDSRVGVRAGPLLLVLTIITLIVALLTVHEIRSGALSSAPAELATVPGESNK